MDAYQQGMDAGLSNATVDQNPYDEASAEYSEWDRGYADAKYAASR